MTNGFFYLSSILFIIAEQTPSERDATQIELLEDGYGDEVYYNYVESGGKLPDDSDLDEEHM